jgi:hypothetical protein
MGEEFTVTLAYPGPFVVGDLIEIQGAMNAYWNTRAEVLSVSGTFLTLRPASWWNLLRSHFHSRVWLPLRWAFADAYLELCDIWDEAKTDWRSTS